MNRYFAENDRSRLLPFLWLKGEDEQTLRRGVNEVHDAGCGAVCVESRTHPDFMGDSWWRDLDIILDECKRLGMKLWILDDEHFPSGYAAGKAAGTPYQRMLLTERHMDVIGPIRDGAFVAADDEHPFRKGEGVAAVIAARRLDESDRQDAFTDIGGWKLGETVDLTPTLKDGMVYWDVPQGIWRVFVLTARYVTERTPPKCFTNPLLPDSSRLMIEAVYEPHYQHFKGEFGRTFMGFFSDEPALRAGRGYHGVLGEYPFIPIPWRSDMLSILDKALGESAAPLLPGLWYDIGPRTKRIRYALMDTVSRLYGENYSMPLGAWCREHGVSYIGHVIEQNNTHARLGSGAGHYFRAVSGQQMAGIDIVLHEVRPEFNGVSHAWQSQDYEADDDFFRYMLAQMAVSCAYLDKEKQGRTMCEIFGAYGWQEDIAEMRYLAYLMLSRGVNFFTPHAFTMQAFPDPDSPPHFDFTHHPMIPYLGGVLRQMAKVGQMIDGGQRICRAAAVYYAEAEWANGSAGCMKTQAVVKALNQSQIECCVLPIDRLEDAGYDVLFIPRAESWPEKLLVKCRALMDKGVKVFFIDALPAHLSAGKGDLDELLAGIKVIPLSGAARAAREWACLPYRSDAVEPRVHMYPYEKDGDRLFLLFNENTKEAADYRFTVQEGGSAYVLDPEKETCVRADAETEGIQTSIRLRLEPAQMKIAVFTQRALACTEAEEALRPILCHNSPWRISLKPVTEENYTHYAETEELFNITAPDRMPRFTGTVRYETEADLPGGISGLSLGACCYCVKAFIDGEPAGECVAAPYEFRFAPLKAGKHTLKLEVSNTPVFMHRDRLSFFACVKPTGILGPVEWLGGTK
ncbi:MAG: hypothetical protein II912_11765 [Clostridia bacterium]|nr:hypothetical protein [Clostridia bacterium]